MTVLLAIAAAEKVGRFQIPVHGQGRPGTAYASRMEISLGQKWGKPCVIQCQSISMHTLSTECPSVSAQVHMDAIQTNFESRWVNERDAA